MIGTVETPRELGDAARREDVDEETSLVSVVARRVVPVALLVGLFAVLARVAAQPLSNGDTFFHLRFGHEFLTGAWSLSDPGSVTSLGTARWTPTQWLPQLVMAQLDSWWGLPAVAWFNGLQLLALAVTIYWCARRWSEPVVAAPVTLFAVIAAGPGLSMRPQVMSYLLAAVTVTVWMAVRESGRTPWPLVPLTWFWATYHGMWPIGVVIGLVAVTGLGLDGAARGRALLRHLAVPLLSLLAAGLTPVGPRLYAAVLQVGSRGRYFSEWGPPELTQPNAIALLVLLATTVLVAARRGDTSWTRLLLLAVTVACAVYSNRTVPVAAAMAAPLAAHALQQLVGRRTRPARPERVLVVGSALVTLAVLAVVTPHTSSEPAPQPSWVRPTLSAMPAGTRILDDSVYGGYLMWAYPQLDVVMSGYGDIYTDDEIKRNYDIEAVAPGWDRLVRQTGAEVAMVSSRSSFGYALEQAGWTRTREDDDVLLLQAPAGW